MNSDMPNTHGGKRPGAGRKPKTLERCRCGKHTMARAVRLRLKCRVRLSHEAHPA